MHQAGVARSSGKANACCNQEAVFMPKQQHLVCMCYRLAYAQRSPIERPQLVTCTASEQIPSALVIDGK